MYCLELWFINKFFSKTNLKIYYIQIEALIWIYLDQLFYLMLIISMNLLPQGLVFWSLIKAFLLALGENLKSFSGRDFLSFYENEGKLFFSKYPIFIIALSTDIYRISFRMALASFFHAVNIYLVQHYMLGIGKMVLNKLHMDLVLKELTVLQWIQINKKTIEYM